MFYVVPFEVLVNAGLEYSLDLKKTDDTISFHRVISLFNYYLISKCVLSSFCVA